jgi:hypothetical protein
VSIRRPDYLTKCRLVAVCLLLLFSACSSGKLDIEYVFPDGFRGGAVIRENRPNGIPACRQPSFWRNERCILKFPSSGVVEVQGPEPGTMWHSASARYENGTAIPVPYTTPGTKVPPGTLALWSFGSVQNGEAWLFIGTEEEFRKFRDEHTRYKYEK